MVRTMALGMGLLLLLLLSHFSRVRFCATPLTAAHQAPPSLGFSRQEHWTGLPFPSPMQESEKWKWSRSVVSDSSRPQGLQPTRLLCLWDFPGKSTGVGCHRCPQIECWMICSYFFSGIEVNLGPLTIFSALQLNCPDLYVLIRIGVLKCSKRKQLLAKWIKEILQE